MPLVSGRHCPHTNTKSAFFLQPPPLTPTPTFLLAQMFATVHLKHSFIYLYRAYVFCTGQDTEQYQPSRALNVYTVIRNKSSSYTPLKSNHRLVTQLIWKRSLCLHRRRTVSVLCSRGAPLLWGERSNETVA